MKTIAIFLLLFVFYSKSYSQIFLTRSGYINFFSKTPLENVDAENRQVYAVIDTAKKNIAFTCLVKGFLFKKELMQEHFNENYVESDKYPKTNFIGSFTGDLSGNKNGKTQVQVKGQLTLHGVTQPVEVPATLEFKGNQLIGVADFKLSPADFNIKIPALVREKIARQIDVHVLVECNQK